MKYIYTSNYARKGNDQNAFGISCTVPKWFSGQRLASVAPTWQLVSGFKDGNIDNAEYMKQYFELLLSRDVDPQRFVEALPNNAFLLCYESPGQFCHRRLLAKFIRMFATGVTIEEWRNEKEENHFQQQNFVDEMIGF